MAAAVLTLLIALVCGGGLWLTVGPRLPLSAEAEQNDLLNLLLYVGAIVPLAFVLVLFVLAEL